MKKTESELYKNLYNNHPEYIALRNGSGDIYDKYLDDVRYWKLKYLGKLIQKNNLFDQLNNIVELGCGTGVLLANFPAKESAKKTGIDISNFNIEAAQEQYPDLNFFSGTLDEYLQSEENSGNIDVIIMSDLLEHVEDDSGVLNEAANSSKYCLVNLPIEKVPEYKDREYGIDDIEGHLRAYSVQDALEMFDRAGTTTIQYYVKTYVKQPVFRKYLLNKLMDKFDDKTDALFAYQQELNHIDIHTDYYKKNIFALLKKK